MGNWHLANLEMLGDDILWRCVLTRAAVSEYVLFDPSFSEVYRVHTESDNSAFVQRLRSYSIVLTLVPDTPYMVK